MTDPSKPKTGYRWTILALLFAATTINYVDRSVINVLAPTLQYKVFNWTDQQYAHLQMAFMTAYAIGMLTMGAVIDRFGTRLGYILSIGIWSLFGLLHSAVRPAFGLIGFALCRFGLGFGESGNFPAAQKTVAEWFPKKERALATGLYNAGSNVGAILAPALIPLIVVAADGHDWYRAFFMTFAFSLIWVICWAIFYKRPETHPKISKSELEYIHSDQVVENTERVPWSKVIPLRETWAFSIGKLTDAAWWFYLFWGGKFLFDQFGLDIKSLALPLIIIYLVADAGSIFGGWISSRLIKIGWPINKARKLTLLCCALCIMPVMFVTQVPTVFKIDEGYFKAVSESTYRAEEIYEEDGIEKIRKVDVPIEQEIVDSLHALDGKTYKTAKELLGEIETVIGPEKTKTMSTTLLANARSDSLYWIAVLLIALAAGGHQAWSANLFTLVSDVFPKKATASVTGIGGMMGAVAGIVSNQFLGKLLTTSGPAGYFVAFLCAGLVYIVTLGIAHALMPKMTPLDENLKRATA